jgi:hypothetical protein
MNNYMVGYYHEVRPKGELCDCGHEKDSHSGLASGDTICYGSGDCKCGGAYASRVRIPLVGSIQEVNLNIKKPQFRPQMATAKIIKVHGVDKVFHRNYGEDAYVLCTVELRGKKMLAYCQWVDEESIVMGKEDFEMLNEDIKSKYKFKIMENKNDS